MLGTGYIRLYRSLLNWEWYQDRNTKAVFLHLLLTANYEPQKWQGIVVERGQIVGCCVVCLVRVPEHLSEGIWE